MHDHVNYATGGTVTYDPLDPRTWTIPLSTGSTGTINSDTINWTQPFISNVHSGYGTEDYSSLESRINNLEAEIADVLSQIAELNKKLDSLTALALFKDD